TGGSKEQAGRVLELELEMSKVQFVGATLSVPEYVDLLQALSEAAQRGQASLKTRTGPLGNLAFNRFVEGLLVAAWQRCGRWTNYRQANAEWVGTLLEAITILRPYLPLNFFPDGELGRAVDYARTKFKKHVTKS